MTLSERIEHDLAAMIDSGKPLPFRLTLSGIAQHYGVSAMPVRHAVDRLVERDVLSRLGNGRLEGRGGTPDVHHQDVAVPATAPIGDDIDQRISNAVIKRCLTCDTHYLREIEVAQAFGVGRTVVRRILGHLAGQGVIEHVPRCGWRVRPCGEKDMLDYLDIREILELKALEIAAPVLDHAVLQNCMENNQPGRPGQPAILDDSLHREWIDRSENRYIIDFFERNAAFYIAIFDHAAIDPLAADRMAQQHQAILSALLSGDVHEAKAALSNHIRSQQPNVAKLLSEMPSYAL